MGYDRTARVILYGFMKQAPAVRFLNREYWPIRLMSTF